jgi:hypothetical protein
MYEIVSVDQAIEKGMKMVTIPVLLIVPAAILFGVWLGEDTAYVKIYSWVGIGVGVFMAMLYWSFMSTRWRLWAFDNVRNVHELHKRATGYMIIGWDVFEKLEYRTAKQKQRWAELQQKFYRPDIFVEDFTVSDETRLHYSKIKSIINFVLGVFMIGIAVYLYFDEEPGKNYKAVAVVALLLGCYMAYSYFKKYNSTSPPIILSNRGIEKPDRKFYGWEQIRGENTKTKYHGQISHHYLVFDSPDGFQEINIDDLSIKKEKLEHLLRIYRSRFEDRQKLIQSRNSQ